MLNFFQIQIDLVQDSHHFLNFQRDFEINSLANTDLLANEIACLIISFEILDPLAEDICPGSNPLAKLHG